MWFLQTLFISICNSIIFLKIFKKEMKMLAKVLCPCAQFHPYVYEQSTIKKELRAFFNITHNLFIQKKLHYLLSIKVKLSL
jgi:hypothetical protein